MNPNFFWCICSVLIDSTPQREEKKNNSDHHNELNILKKYVPDRGWTGEELGLP